MKKLFTIDDFMIAFVSALGYGFGERIPRLFGWPDLACMGASLVVGIAIEAIMNKIVFSKAVQTRPLSRFFIYGAFVLGFVAAHHVSMAWMGVSMVDYLLQQFATVVGIPILGFVVTMLIRAYRAWKIRERYGDGSEGYVFDVNKEDIEELNQANQLVDGEYDADCAVKTRTGVYVGERQGGTISYLGVPYAKPPVGELRWKAPEPLPASDAVFAARHFGASAIQVEHAGLALKEHRQSEDCLSLNICVADEEAEQKKPVLVLFHHGDFTYGGSADPLLYGSGFVGNHPDIVFVSFNYRLGVFGFVDFSEVPGGKDYPDALNLGLLDQVAALTWINENISAFGGDPDRVTVVGFESGAISISLLAACDQAKGLFQKAFVFFGSPALAFDTPTASRALARSLLEETQTATMEGLLQLKTESLKDASQKLWLNMCGPTCDGALIPADVDRAYQDGAASGIEFIMGFPGNEMQVYRSFVGKRNYEDFVSGKMAEMQNHVDESVASALQEYIDAQASASTELEAKSELIEQWAALGIYRSASKLHEGGNSVHLMFWDEKPLIEKLGSGTIDVAAALLGNTESLQMYGNVMNEDLSEVLQSLLQKFVNGDALQLYPNEIKGVDSFDWKPFPQALVVADGDINLVAYPNEEALWSAMQG
ncbi:MAG: carboxylesterase/lipase family protein [Eggerthellaceae bacterium]|nr:carboxylesterase/lipase family protein [Eggerthellaceae bacterium]